MVADIPDWLLLQLEKWPEQLRIVAPGERYTGYIRVNYLEGGVTNVNVERSIRANGGKSA